MELGNELVAMSNMVGWFPCTLIVGAVFPINNVLQLAITPTRVEDCLDLVFDLPLDFNR